MPRSTQSYRTRLIREALVFRAKLDQTLSELDNLVDDAPDLDAIVMKAAEEINGPDAVSDDHIAAVEAAIAQQAAEAAARTLHALHALSRLTVHTGTEAQAQPLTEEPPTYVPTLGVPSSSNFTAIIGPSSLTLLTDTGAVPITEQGRGLVDTIRRGIADALRAVGYTPVGIYIDSPEDGRRWFMVGAERKTMDDAEAIQLLQLTRLRGSPVDTSEYALPAGGFDFGRDLPRGNQATTIPLTLNGVEVVVSQRSVEDAISYLLALHTSPSERITDFLYAGLVSSFREWFGEQAQAVIDTAQAEAEEEAGEIHEDSPGEDLDLSPLDKAVPSAIAALELAVRLRQLGYSADAQTMSAGHHLLMVDGMYPMHPDEARSLIQVTEQRGEPIEIRDFAEHFGRGRGGDDEKYGWSYDFTQAIEPSKIVEVWRAFTQLTSLPEYAGMEPSPALRLYSDGYGAVVLHDSEITGWDTLDEAVEAIESQLPSGADLPEPMTTPTGLEALYEAAVGYGAIAIARGKAESFLLTLHEDGSGYLDPRVESFSSFTMEQWPSVAEALRAATKALA